MEKKQEELEEKLIVAVETELKEILPVLEGMRRNKTALAGFKRGGFSHERSRDSGDSDGGVLRFFVADECAQVLSGPHDEGQEPGLSDYDLYRLCLRHRLEDHRRLV